MSDSEKNKDQSTVIAKIYDQMMKEIMLPPLQSTKETESIPDANEIIQTKEEAKKKQPILVDSFT